jgi:hypothetical protein
VALKIANKQTLIRVAKNVGALGGGIVSAKVGGHLLRRASTSIAEFAAKTDDEGNPTLNAGHVEAAGGVLVAAPILYGLKKLAKVNVMPALPAVGAGILISAYGGRMIDKAVTYGFELIDKMFDGSDDADDAADALDAPAPAGGIDGSNVIDMPQLRRGGGLYAQERGRHDIGLGGELRRGLPPKGGGLYAQDLGNARVGLGGELRRGGGRKMRKGGGLFPEKGYGPRLGGELRRRS